MVKIFSAFMICFAFSAFVLANATIPKTDIKGGKDSPLLKRYEGSFIVAYQHKSFDEFSLPLSKLEPVGDKRDANNNQVFEPKQSKQVEGEVTHIVYLMPADRTPLEVLRNYQEEVQNKGGKVLFECKGAECGGSETRSSSGGGGDMSLSMYLLPQQKVVYHDFTNDYCAVTCEISDQRYFSAELPSENAHVSVLAYTLHDETYCKEFNTRTIAMVDIIQSKAREQKMVTVNATEMASKIASAGSVALYGIYFDFNKADL
jgi:OOP family OmpA-OmpF porin